MGEGSSFVMADIPGLIEGAGQGVGLGHEFLRHVERCRLLLHVIDISGSEGRDPIDDFEKINNELKVFSEELSERPQIVVGNKCDLVDEEEVERIGKYFTDKGYAFFPIMAAIAEGTKELIDHTAATLATLPAIKIYEPEVITENIVVDFKDKQTFTINYRDGIYYVDDADWVDDIMNKVDPDDYESLQYFERALRSSGIIKALEQAGAGDGDTVSICGVEFDYVP